MKTSNVTDTLYTDICQGKNLTSNSNCGIIQESVKVTLSMSSEIRYLLVERRRALLTELAALEIALGYSPTTCELRREWNKDR